MNENTTLQDHIIEHWNQSMEIALPKKNAILCGDAHHRNWMTLASFGWELYAVLTRLTVVVIFYRRLKKFMMSFFLTRLILNHLSQQGVWVFLMPSKDKAIRFTAQRLHHRGSTISDNSRNSMNTPRKPPTDILLIIPAILQKEPKKKSTLSGLFIRWAFDFYY